MRFDELAARSVAALEDSARRALPPPFQDVVRRRARRSSPLVAVGVVVLVVVAVGVPAWLIAPTGSDSTGGLTRPLMFNPLHTVADGIATYSLRLADGKPLTITLPEELASEIVGFQPGMGVGWDEGVCCGRQLRIEYGTFGDLYPSRTPDREYRDASGRPVHFYFSEEGTDELAFQLGSWVVIAWDGGPGPGETFDEETRARFASLIDGYEDSDGFLILDPIAPMTLMPAHMFPSAALLDPASDTVVSFFNPHGSCRGEPLGRYLVSEAPPQPDHPGVTTLCDPDTDDALMIWGRTGLSTGELDRFGFELSGSPPESTSTTLPAFPDDPSVDSQWAQHDPSPLSARIWPSITWTGEELVVWGGAGMPQPSELAFNDGAAFDPATGRWHFLAGSPLEPRVGHNATWVGDRLLIWGGHRGGSQSWATDLLSDGAIYDPLSDSWQPIAPSPLRGGPGYAAVWTGTEVIFVGGNNGYLSAAERAWSEAAAYNLAEDSWTMITPEDNWRLIGLPGEMLSHDAAWVGDVLILVGQRRVQEPLLVWAFSPRTGGWRELPSPALSNPHPKIAVVGGRVVVSSYIPEEEGMAAFDLSTGEWVAIGQLPGSASDGGPLIAAMGVDQLSVQTEDLLGTDLIGVYTFTEQAWSLVPTPAGFRGGQSIWADDRVLFLAHPADLWSYIPPGG